MNLQHDKALFNISDVLSRLVVMFNQNFGRKIRMNLKDRISKMEGIINMPTAKKRDIFCIYIFIFSLYN